MSPCLEERCCLDRTLTTNWHPLGSPGIVAPLRALGSPMVSWDRERGSLREMILSPFQRSTQLSQCGFLKRLAAVSARVAPLNFDSGGSASCTCVRRPTTQRQKSHRLAQAVRLVNTIFGGCVGPRSSKNIQNGSRTNPNDLSTCRFAVVFWNGELPVPGIRKRVRSRSRVA